MFKYSVGNRTGIHSIHFPKTIPKWLTTGLIMGSLMAFWWTVWQRGDDDILIVCSVLLCHQTIPFKRPEVKQAQNIWPYPIKLKIEVLWPWNSPPQDIS